MSDTLETLALVEDKSAKTLAFYSLGRAPLIGEAVVAGLKDKLRGGGSTVRICLHDGPQALFHEMLIVHKKGGAFKPHKHPTKDESYHMIEGVLRIDILGDGGRLLETFRIGGPGSGLPFWVRIRKNTWHATIPESDFAVFHESRPGPFQGGDSVFHEG
jgi:cupin fold WbuC family metalloprotein